jgi:hypothetical protein
VIVDDGGGAVTLEELAYELGLRLFMLFRWACALLVLAIGLWSLELGQG